MNGILKTETFRHVSGTTADAVWEWVKELQGKGTAEEMIQMIEEKLGPLETWPDLRPALGRRPTVSAPEDP